MSKPCSDGALASSLPKARLPMQGGRPSKNAIPLAPLQKLPHEILGHIVSYMTPHQATAFVRVSRVFTSITRKRLWGQIRLVPEERRDASPAVDDEGERMVEEESRDNLKWKMRSIILRGNERKFRLVQSMTISPRPGLMPELLVLLGFGSQSLRSLEIEGTTKHRSSSDIFWWPVDHNCFDIRLLEANIYFDSLTYLRLANAPLRFFGTLPLLCNSAHMLHTLIADLSQGLEDWAYDLDIPCPEYKGNTGIQVLALRLEGVWVPDEDGESAMTIVDLLEHSPRLAEVHLHHQGSEIGRRKIMEKLKALQHLRDLAFIISAEHFQVAFDQAEAQDTPVFHRLRRLMLRGDANNMIAYEPIPPLPTLEILLFYYHSHSLGTIRDPDHTQPKANQFAPGLHARLTQVPQLREMGAVDSDDLGNYPVDYSSFDELIRESKLLGTISSVRHRDDELFIVRLLEDVREVEDEPANYDMYAGRYSWSEHRYTAVDGTERVKKFRQMGYWSDEAAWRIYTHYRGWVVPLWVIARMGEMEGACQMHRRGRGVRVGEAAWKVLTEWEEAHRAEELRWSRMFSSAAELRQTGSGKEGGSAAMLAEKDYPE